MKFKRIGRTLICLLLVCVLMVNASPIRAEALSPGLAFAAGSAAASALIGLGISMGSDAFAHNEVVQNAVAHLESVGGFITDGMISVLNLGNGNYGVSSDFIQALRNWMLGNKIVYRSGPAFNSVSAGTHKNKSYNITSLGQDCTVVSVTFIVYTAGATYPYRICNTLRLYAENAGNIKIEGVSGFQELRRSNNGYYYYDLTNSSSETKDPESLIPSVAGDFSEAHLGQYMDYNTGKTVFDAYNPFNVDSDIVTDYDLQLNFIGDPELSLAEGYPEWHANSVVIDGETYYPVALAPTYEGTQSMTQTDVWAGNGTYVESVPDSGTQSGLISDILTAIKAIGTPLADWFSALIGWGQSIWEAIIALPQAITSGIAEVLANIFIPSTDFLTAKVAAIRAEYAFADSVIATGQFIGSALTGLDVEPPVIYIHLEDTEGSYDIGGTVPFVDMTWYSRYKPTGDLLISALLWIVFAWRVFVKLPGIIGGMPGDFVMDVLNHIGFADHMPSRKAEYEVQRISLREQIRRGRK